MAKHKFVLPKELRVPEVFKSCEYDWNNAMKTFDARLGDNQYVMGDKFTIPDIIITHVAGWASSYEFEWPDNVKQYFERVRSRPAFKKAEEIRNK